MFDKLGLQLYTVRDCLIDADFADVTLKKLADLGFSELQTGGYVPDEAFVALTRKYGFSFVGTHYSYDKIVNEPEETMALHRLYGTTNVGIGAMPPEARQNLDALKAFIAQFNKTAELYAKSGFKLTYHNHNFEFVRIDGTKTLMDYLIEGLDPDTTSFVLDTCWIAAGGGDVRAYLEKLAGRVDILHLKDMMLRWSGQNLVATMTEIGNGTLYWDGIMETAEATGVKSYVVEQDGNFIGNNPFASLKVSADYLARYRK